MAKKFYTGIDLASQRAVNAADPQSANDLVTKSYVDNLLAGLRWKEPVIAATTANITLSGTQTVDGVSVGVGDRVLVKDQTTGSENGIYVAAAGAWARATDADSSSELDSATVMVRQGTTNGDQAFTQTADAPVVGTDSITFAQFGGGGASYTADGDGITLSGTTFSLELNGATLSKGASGLKVADGYAGAGLALNADVLSVGAGNGITVNANDVALASTVAGAGLTYTTGVLAVGGGTGITVSADGIAVDTSTVVTTPATVVRKYAANVGALSAGTPLTINHALNTTDVTVSVREVSGGALVEMDVVVSDANNITLTTAGAFAADTFRVVVHG